MLSIDEIMKILPHRYPFLLLDRVVELEPGVRAVAEKLVTINEPFFQGHFPGYPLMPGVLQLEALAQAGAVAALSLPEFAGKEDLEASLLLTQSFCVISGTHHALAHRRKLSWATLHAADWLQAPPNTALHDYFVETFLRHGLTPPRPLYQSASFYSCITILQSSDCLMMVPHEVARHFTRHAAIRILPVRLGEPSTPFSIVRRRSRAEMPAMTAFEDAIRQVVDRRR